MPSTIPSRFRRRAAALGVAAVWLAVAPARAEDPGLSRDPVSARVWLAAHTDIDPATVVLLGDGYAFAATPSGSDGAFAVREEVSNPALIAALGGRSAAISATLDCRSRQSSIGGIRVHPENGLRGEGRPLKAAAWLRTTPVDLVDLAATLCEPGAPRPLGSTALGLPATPAAQAAPADADPPPAPTPEPASREAEPSPLRASLDGRPDAGAPRWVQLGAFAGEALAEAQWTKTVRRVGELAAAGHRVEPVARGGAKLYRLLAGPYADAALAARACRAVRATGAACLVR